MYILMADDDKDDFYILQQAAERTDKSFNISYASNWMNLWIALVKRIPDILFLDLNMPVKDGIECLKLLRAEEKYKELPIVIYSTSVSKADIDKSYENGANYFLVKPNSLEEISQMLKKIYSMGKDLLLVRPSREEFVLL